ncbi:Superoxide dismutase [Alkaliphilus metalliredigens QYMF]|uniref:Superoxide dismutase n=1 Tax=Alkaliphilus metalliredigens (strain QYMF) TaxID=293826 RepID=A6TPE4_ALKMQ|nr:superoxide dismutase [Alkaliphilus metalliredigens]ABR48062.1 Superoxide dismutase [Alkaliphilus metalliredigens QYMF]
MLMNESNEIKAVEKQVYPFALNNIPYSYEDLEPYIDKETMNIHHSRHHDAYVNGANKGLQDFPEPHNKSSVELLKGFNDLSTDLPDSARNAVRNHVGGHTNHALFWEIMAPNSTGEERRPSGELSERITETFGSFDEFKNQFEAAATTRFGSGWAWLVIDKGELKVTSSANQDRPYMGGQTPILGIDVWEHAYYLKYQNKRGSYVSNFWYVINWDEVARRYKAAR